MGVALLAARRSKDPNTQVGACIVDASNVILTTGYNGFPQGCSDDEFPWDREGEVTKYPFVVRPESAKSYIFLTSTQTPLLPRHPR